MKKLLVLVAVFLAISIFPLATYADGHDQDWKDQHAQQWSGHSRQWSEYDREWQAHPDRHWREEHARMWRDWYQWHRDDDGSSGFGIQFSSDDLNIDINL